MTETTFDRVGSLSPRDGAAEALARLLMERLEARVFGGTAADRAVKLEAVFTGWPDLDRLCTPCASISDVVLRDDDCEPIDLDLDIDDDGNELAARVSEQEGEFGVDLWATDREERRALEAAFNAVFRMGTSRGGVAVIVALPDEALPPSMRGARVRFIVRLTLAEPARNVGEREGALEDLWRAHARVSWDAEFVTAIDAERADAVVFNVTIDAPRDAPSPVTG